MQPAPVADLNQAAAEAAVEVLQRHAPQEAEAVAAYVYRLFAALQEGHAFLWLDDGEADTLRKLETIVSDKGNTPLILMGKKLFLGRIWQLEHDVATEIVRLAGAPISGIDGQAAAEHLQNWFAGKSSEGQRDAAALALLEPFMLISGGPGTGKTTTVAKLLGLLCSGRQALPRIALAAPTGKAAAHMARALHRAVGTFALPESIRNHLLQLDGQTVHRLLKLRPPEMMPSFHAEYPLPLDILVVDEASMLDISLLLQLLRAIPTGCRLILLGDENQLPSVGAGAVLAQLAQATVLDNDTAAKLAALLPQHGLATADQPPPLAQNIARLQVSHRFGDNSGIGALARAVIKGDSGEAWTQFDSFPNELHLNEGSLKQQAEMFYGRQANYWRAVDTGDIAAAFEHQTDIMVLAARRCDAEAFNETYRYCLQRHGRARADVPWFAGQVVMVSRNDYALDVFNGDIGLIMPDTDKTEETALAAYFPLPEGYRKIALSRLPEHGTAFAITVHKSQGSEYREVWLLPPTEEENEPTHGLNKALLYTAITRAREQFVFWGSKTTFQTACSLDEKRRSALREMIGQIMGQTKL